MSSNPVSRSDLPPEVGYTSPLASPRPELPSPHALAAGGGAPLKAKEIKREELGFFNDPQWMAFLNNLFGTASLICSLMPAGASEFVPYLGIFSSPFYLKHAINESIRNLKLMVSAFKSSSVAEGFFWMSGAGGSLGTAIGNIIKPIGGGIVIFGLSSIPALHTTLTLVIPIILIVFSVIGGINQNWSIVRSELALHHFIQRREGMRSLKEMKTLLAEMKAPTAELHEIELFKEIRFTSESRYQEIEEKIEQLMNHHEARMALSKCMSLIQKTRALTSGPLFEEVDSALEICEQAIQIASQHGQDTNEFLHVKKELNQIKMRLQFEGSEILDTYHSELHRKIMGQYVTLLCALLSLGAGILYLTTPQAQHYMGYIFSLNASAIGAINIVFDKSVSQQNYLALARKLKVLEIKPS